MREKAFASTSGFSLAIARRWHEFVQRARSSELIWNICETFATRLILMCVGIGISVIVARSLGPEGRGLYAVVMAIGALGVQLGNAGLHSSNTFSVARNRSLTSALVSNSLFVSIVLGGLGATAIWFVFSFRPQWSPLQEQALLALSLASIPIGLAYLMLQSLVLGLGKIRTYNSIELFTKILTVFGFSIILVLGVKSVERYCLAGVVATGVGLVMLLRLLYRNDLDVVPPSFALLQENIVYSMKGYWSSLMSFLVLRIDLLMVQYLLGAEEAGYYSIATSMGDVFCMLPVVVGAILFPKLSGFASDGQKWSLTKEASLWVTAFISLFAILAAILARPTIQFFYGEAFIPAVSPFLWLLPGLIILSVNTVFMNYFASIGMPSVVVYSPAIATLLNIGMNLKLVPWLGIVGASLSSGVCYGVMLLFSLLYIHRKRLADEP